MQVAVLFRAQLDPPQHPQTQGLPGLGGLVQATDRVVVRQGQYLHPGFPGPGHQLGGGVLAVRGGGVGVQIYLHGSVLPVIYIFFIIADPSKK